MRKFQIFAYIGILSSAILLSSFALAQKTTPRDQVAATLQSMIRIQATDDNSRTAHRIALQLQDWIWEMSPHRIELIKRDMEELNGLTLNGDLATFRTKLNSQMPAILPK